MATKKDDSGTAIVIKPVATKTIEVALIGLTPIILNRVSQKAKRALLLPSGRKTTAERAATNKHDPIAEFQGAPYCLEDETAPTLLAIPSTSVKGAMMTAALDLPGVQKTQIGRLAFVDGFYVPIYGVPKLFMAVTRSADIGRTPDIRTRAIIDKWACIVTITFVTPILTDTAIVNLLASGGFTCGIGDWRPEKGKGNFGQYRVAGVEDAEYRRIAESGDRERQAAAMSEAEPYDSETRDMLEWAVGEIASRGRKAS